MTSTTDDKLGHLAFDNSLRANIISVVSSGKIIMVNNAACKLLGYPKKELLTKCRADIFDIKESSFRKMLKQRTAEGQSEFLVTSIKKSGKRLPCKITSAVFIGENGIEKSITTIADMSQDILKQKEIDIKKEKRVADNIELALEMQTDIDVENKKRVAKNIMLAITKQLKIDAKNKKIVADNIALAISNQKNIDSRKEKIVARNIVIAILKQKEIDVNKEKIVADNIILAKSKQKKIDIKKEKIVAHDIVVALKKSDDRLAENNEWIKYIAKTSYDVMWDWDIPTNEIYVGDSIEEVFGYSVKNNIVNFADFIECLLPEEKDTVEIKLRKTLATGNKSWNDSFMFKRQDGSVAFTTSRAYIIRNKKGKAIRLIGAIQDVSRLQEMETKLDKQISMQGESKEMFFQVAKISFDVLWDRNLLTNDVIRGEGFEELLGYPLKDYKDKVSDWSDHIHPDDKTAVEKSLEEAIASSAVRWGHVFRIIRADGSIAKVFDRASIFRRADGKAYRMIGALHDLSRQMEIEEQLENEIAGKEKLLTEYNERFKLIFNSSSDVLYDNDLTTGNVIISDAYEKEYGYKINSNMTPANDWISHIHPDDKEKVYATYINMLGSAENEWEYSYRFLKADDSVVNVTSKAIILRHRDGKPYRIIGSMQDLNRQTLLDEKIEQEIKLKEKQIADAIVDAKEAERSEIGQELHDNVNQLLGASRMYLEMAKKGGPDSETYLSRTSEYTMTAIEEIRKLTKGLSTDYIRNLGLCDAIENIARDTMEVNPVKISCALEKFIENSVNNKFKLNVYRIVQEQLNNILKHAKATEVNIILSQNKKTILFSIADNGVGFDTAKKRKGIGVANIKSRAASYNGTADFVSQPGQGCTLNITFPVTDALMN